MNIKSILFIIYPKFNQVEYPTCKYREINRTVFDFHFLETLL